MKVITLLEDIFRSLSHPGMLSLTVNTHEKKHRGGDRESISTATPLPLRISTSKTNGVPVYYAYNYLHSSEVVELLKAIKGKNELKVDTRQLELFFIDTANYMAAGLKQRKIQPDVIVCPASNSIITKTFASYLAQRLGGISVITDAFIKQKTFKLPEYKAAALKAISDKFINHELIHAKYHGADIDKFVNRIALTIYSSIKRHDGALELKDIDKQVGKFIKGFMDLDTDIEYQLINKDVLIVDDVLSSGSTMAEIIRLVQNECLAKTINGAVIFNMTTAKMS